MARSGLNYKHIPMYKDVTSQTVLCHMNFVLAQLEPQMYFKARSRFVKERATDNFFGQSQKEMASHIRYVTVGSGIDEISVAGVQPRGLGRYSKDDFMVNHDIDTLYIMNMTVGYMGDPTDFIIDTSETYPGYFQIVWLVDPVDPINSDRLFELTHEHLPEQMGYRQLGRNGPSVVYGHETLTEPKIDQVPTGKCYSWPREATAWQRRPSKTGWPPQSLKDDIYTSTCHFVFKAHRLSRHPSSEFRFSFIDGEHKLISTLTLEQKHCFVIFKMLVKYVLPPDSDISSYCLKTTLFWTLETVPSDIWEDPVHGMAVGFLQLMDKLIHFLIERKLPQYFIPENNLIAHIDKSELKNVVRKLVNLRKRPVETVLDYDRKYSIGGNLLIRDKLSEIFHRITSNYKIRDCKQTSLEECLNVHREEIAKYFFYALRELTDVRGAIGALKLLQIYDELNGLPKRYLVCLLRDTMCQFKDYGEVLNVAKICGVAFLNDDILEEPLAARSRLLSTTREIFEYALSELPLISMGAVVYYAIFLMRCNELPRANVLLEDAIKWVQALDFSVLWIARLYAYEVPWDYLNEIVYHLDPVLQLLVRDDGFVNLPNLLLTFYLLVDLYIQRGAENCAREMIATFVYYCDSIIPKCQDSDRQHGYALLAFSFMKLGEYWSASRAFEAHRMCLGHAAYKNETKRFTAMTIAVMRCNICKAMAVYREYGGRKN